jgi:hypothetical protein
MRRRAGLEPLLSWCVGLGLLVLTLGVPGCVNDTPSTEPPEEVQKFILDKLPEGEKFTELNVNFDDKITLLGAQIEPGLVVEPGGRVKITLYWRVDKPLGDVDWKLFTHVLDTSGERLMNIDNVGPLRHIRRNRQSWPPGSWVAGKIYVDSQSFTMPRKLKTAKVQVVTGIWKGRERMPLRSGPSISDNRALIATLDTGVTPKGDDSVPQLQVAQIKQGLRVRLDGKLSEYAWETAADTTLFVNVATGKPAPESPVQGSAKLLWDETALYLGITVKDQNLVGGFDKKQKDPHLWTKDCVEIMIDPDGDGDNKDYYEIQVNPQNLVFDTFYDDYNKPQTQPDGPFGHEDWSSKIESAVQLQGTLDNPKDKDEGYVVEIKLPWSSFDKAKKVPPEPGTSWRMNLYVMKENNGVAWSPILGQGNFHKASRFGRIQWQTQPVAPEAVAKTEEKKPGAESGGTVKPAALEEPMPDKEGLSVTKKALQQAPATPAAPTPAPVPAAPSPAAGAPGASPDAPQQQ